LGLGEVGKEESGAALPSFVAPIRPKKGFEKMAEQMASTSDSTDEPNFQPNDEMSLEFPGMIADPTLCVCPYFQMAI
jgi:hypothetical protein